MLTFNFSKKTGLFTAFLLFVSLVFAQEEKVDALSILKEGNKRFYSGQLLHEHQSLETVKELVGGQNPKAVIISCSDSRVTPEILFDQGLGDIFSIRTAGNVMSDYEEGSVEYAVEHLGTNLVVVMGHHGCGAVKAFLNYAEHKEEHEDHAEVANHINSIIEKMSSEDEQKTVLEQPGDHYEKSIEANVINGVNQLRKSDPILAHLYKEGKVQIIGAIYHIENGQVEFLDY
ncbi:carbonic anhydrase [Dysgonomonas sp. ZJ279]|uniref:carbonic anhydrase n=1 Tax=Dysgonomonas sp. ZJ279 TaxID=2709796 RepID=UPI0013EB94E7|nr:carbonic anhydrase [Dysgonomonas sp. ZJ279]